MILLVGNISEEFYSEEKLFRAFSRNNPNMIDKTGKVTSAVFKDSNGLSVDREWHRSSDEAVDVLLERIAQQRSSTADNFYVVSVTKGCCDDIGVQCLYKPVEDNEYHSEIHDSNEVVTISKPHARALARAAIVETVIVNNS